MRKINLLHIISLLPIGGAEHILFTLSKNIDKNRFNLVFCCLDGEGYLAERIKEEGFIVYCLKEDRFRYIFRQMFNLYKLIKKEKIDIVHTHLYKADFWGRLVAFIAGVPVICKTEHSVQHPMIFGVWSKWRAPIYNIMKLLGINMFLDWRTDGIIYNTKYARESFLGKKNNSGKYFVVPGAEAKDILTVSASKEILRNKLGFSPDDFIIIIVGRLIERKGHKYLLEAFAELSFRYPKMKLLIVGSGGGTDGKSCEEELKKMAIRLNIANKTFFMGKVDSAQEYIKMSNVLVLPSWKESLGLIILEAMYLGTPVIGSNDAGIPEIIEDGVNGYLVKVKDSKSIEEAILKVINEPEKTKRMAKNARKKFDKRFSEKSFIEKYERTYMSLLRKKAVN